MDIDRELTTSSRLQSRGYDPNAHNPMKKLSNSLTQNNGGQQPNHLLQLYSPAPEPKLVYPGLNAARRGLWHIKSPIFKYNNPPLINDPPTTDYVFITPYIMTTNRLLIQSANYIMSHWHEYGFKLTMDWTSVSVMRGFFERYRILPNSIFKEISSLGYIPTLTELLHSNDDGTLTTLFHTPRDFLKKYTPTDSLPDTQTTFSEHTLSLLNKLSMKISKQTLNKSIIPPKSLNQKHNDVSSKPEPEYKQKVIFDQMPDTITKKDSSHNTNSTVQPEFFEEFDILKDGVFLDHRSLNLNLDSKKPIFKGDFPSLLDEIHDEQSIHETVSDFRDEHEKKINSIQKAFHVEPSPKF